MPPKAVVPMVAAIPVAAANFANVRRVMVLKAIVSSFSFFTVVSQKETGTFQSVRLSAYRYDRMLSQKVLFRFFAAISNDGTLFRK